MNTERPAGLAVLVPAVALAALFSVGGLAYDFPCMPGYAESGLAEETSRGGALIACTRLALGNSGTLIPLFLGYLAILGSAFGAPLLFEYGTRARKMAALAPIAAILSGLAINLFAGPGHDCAQGMIAWTLLGKTAMATGFLIAIAYFLGRLADRA